MADVKTLPPGSGDAVTEVAFLILKTQNNPLALDSLKQAAKEQATYSKHGVALLRSHQSPQYIYLIGGWTSIDQHMNEWIPGPINQKLLETLNPFFDVNWMFHVEADPSAVFSIFEQETTFAIVRYRGEERDGRSAFSGPPIVDKALEMLGDNQCHRYGGWRLDRGFDPEEATRDEFVLFSSWTSAEDRNGFDSVENVARYSQVASHSQMKNIEIGFGQALHVEPVGFDSRT